MSVKFYLQKKSFCAIGGGGGGGEGPIAGGGGGGNVYGVMVVPKKLLQDHPEDSLSISADSTNARLTPNQQLIRFPDIPRAFHVSPSLVDMNFLYILSLSRPRRLSLRITSFFVLSGFLFILFFSFFLFLPSFLF